jgi:hypothetical protein
MDLHPNRSRARRTCGCRIERRPITGLSRVDRSQTVEFARNDLQCNSARKRASLLHCPLQRAQILSRERLEPTVINRFLQHSSQRNHVQVYRAPGEAARLSLGDERQRISFLPGSFSAVTRATNLPVRTQTPDWLLAAIHNILVSASNQRCRCGEMADAQDLKSWDRKKSCGFESHHRHQNHIS